MTCYQRHLHWLFEDLGLDYEKSSRDRVDHALRAMLGIPDSAHCPQVWAAIKELPEGGLADRVPDLRQLLADADPH